MIYIDVTSAAASPMNMGVQRTVRGLYSHVKQRHPVTPLRWDFAGRCYATLSSREQGFLDRPFAAYRKSAGTPGRWDGHHILQDGKDWWTRPRRRMATESLLGANNTLLIPDLCWDRRIRAWSDMAELPGRKIAIFHDAMPLRIPGQADSHDKLFAEYVRQLARMDFVICISREVENDLLRYWREFGLPPQPTRVLGWPVPFENERPDCPPNREARRVIYVARLKLRKNHLVLLDACEKLWTQGEDFALDLVGIADAFTDTRKILRRVRALAQKGRRVQWRKHISDAELTQAYRDCSFTVFPSQLEGFGLPIIESLWHARPVICGRNGAIGEIAAGGGCLFVDQNEADQLAAAMGSLLNDAVLYQRLYEEARIRAFRSWDDYGRALDEVLAS